MLRLGFATCACFVTCGGARRLVVRVRQRVASQPSAMRRPRATARTPGWAGAARQSREWAGRPRNTSVWERGIAGQVRQSQRAPSQVLPIWQPFRAHSSAPDLKGAGRTARSARCRCGHSGCPDCAHPPTLPCAMIVFCVPGPSAGNPDEPCLRFAQLYVCPCSVLVSCRGSAGPRSVACEDMDCHHYILLHTTFS
jgi:hypothetical protein